MSSIDSDQMESLAHEAFGSPNPNLSQGSRLRFGRKGSVSVDINEGVWYDHEVGQGGGAVDLYRLVHGRDPSPGYIVSSDYRHPPPRTDKPTDVERAGWARHIWDESRDAKGSRVEKYLNGRCITIPVPDVLRYHSRLWHKQGDGWWPAMVAAVHDVTGKLVAVHRTWLDHRSRFHAKASIEPNKMSLGPTQGHAIHLAPAGPTLLIGEGIETVLSAMQESSLPGWSAISAGNMENLLLPPVVREVVILQDNDKAGAREAAYAASRFKQWGLYARIARPPEGCSDFNDQLTGKRS
jgi:putative DNA primase/helicase